jgi:hypothetical protein
LEDLQRETDIVAPCQIRAAVGPVHLLAHIGGDRLVEIRFERREIVTCRVGTTLREKRRAVGPVKLLLGQPAHHVGDIGLVNAFAEPALEPVGVEEAHEQLEVGLLAIVRRRRHQEEVARPRAEQPTELVTLRFLNLSAEIGSGHAVGLVADHQIPFRCGGQLRFQFIRARRHVEPDDQPVALDERVAGDRGFDLIARQRVETQTEFLRKFVLPLLDEITGSDDQAAVEIAADQQLLDKQARHDGLAGAGVVGEQEAEWLSRQHLAIDRGDLLRQRLDLRRADRKIRIKQVRQTDALRFGGEPQQAAVGVERIRTPGLDKFERCFLAAIDQTFADAAVRPKDQVNARPARPRQSRRNRGPRNRAPGVMSSNASM